MANSPSCSSTSPSTSITTMTTDLQETDVFSDDSGVDVKPQINKPQERLLKFAQEQHDMLTECNRRNKRKSSEPKKRKDVLLMKRFRWDTDDEDNELDNRLEEEEDMDDVFDRERPSSGDSGCQLGSSTSLDLSTKKSLDFSAGQIPESLDLSTRKVTSTELPKEGEKKKKQKQWRKPKAAKTLPEIKKEPLPTFRQSVIRKHEPCSSSQLDTTKDLSLLSSDGESIVQDHPHSPATSDTASHEFNLGLLDGQETSPGRSHGRSVGRPRNYKSMSRQRRIEANARERTRVHTISAAFENLRRAVPAYAHNQKLSKLAILRIASAYIVALACLNDQDYSQNQTAPDLSECVEQCTRTIQAEGRSRRRSTKD